MVLNLPLVECIDNTHLVIQEKKKKEKKQIKETPTSDRKPKKGKEQDHLKKTSLGPLRQGQRLDTSKTKPCSSKEHKPPKQTRSPPAHMQIPPEPKHTSFGLVHAQQPKPVRPVSKTGQADFIQQTTPPKAKNAKEIHKLPLGSWDRF
jgi:hypothetical protein